MVSILKEARARIGGIVGVRGNWLSIQTVHPLGGLLLIVSKIFGRRVRKMRLIGGFKARGCSVLTEVKASSEEKVAISNIFADSMLLLWSRNTGLVSPNSN